MRNGQVLQVSDIGRILVIQTEQSSVDLRPRPVDLVERIKQSRVTDWQLVTVNGRDVTNEFISEPPRRPATPPPPAPIAVQPPPSPAPSPYVNKQIVEAIRAKEGHSAFDLTKLLGLIEELNQNYARRNTYAAHALLRAILDHIPPILGCADFAAVANNYFWGRTDKRYMKRLAAQRPS